VPLETLFRDWAMVVSALKKLPSGYEYEKMSDYSQTPLTTRFGIWSQVPHGLKQFIEDQARKEPGWLEEWKDVLELIAAHEKAEADLSAAGRGRPGRRREPVQNRVDKQSKIFGVAHVQSTHRKAFPDRPLYGPLIHPYPLAHGPTNELGVLFLVRWPPIWGL